MSEIIEAWARYRGYYIYHPNSTVPYPWKGRDGFWIYSNADICQRCKQEMRSL